MRNFFIIVIVASVLAAAILLLVPYLKPNNRAFAPDQPSSHISKRLKGIFRGMKGGFSSE
jgi:hypothetical protein